MDAASGGAIVNKTPREARELISIMAANSQQFGFRQDTSSRRVNEQVKACGIYDVIGHPTDMCSTLQDDSHEYANAIGRFLDPPQRKYDPYLNTYNPGWRDHPNLSYGPRSSQFQRSPHEQSSSKPGMSLEEIVKSLETNTQQFQQETRTSIQNLENQMSQLASSVNRLESQGKLPSQTIVNPKQNVSAITLRSGKELKEPSPLAHGRALDKKAEKEVVAPQTQKDQPKGLKSEKPKEFVIESPFPSRFAKSKKKAEEKEILKTFRKIEVNIPLLDVIKKVPRYAKVLKESCTNKRKLKGNEKVSMGENVSDVFQKKLPPKYKDPGMFTIPCKLGNVRIERAMLDLGASINVMPLSIYSSLNVGPLKETGVIIQLADRSNVYPEGVLEDV
ncbi:uncharacterized protein LOC120191588 [Hibiscus syriacus]|uniref:uncharacterized protein LOC120191588 n=1 Tax=Hibiscus syriacus TaxID=106335 RepID=UPI001920FB5B|nr:uncharacterized protein LOC120191588 [Hibiscus syriacus]